MLRTKARAKNHLCGRPVSLRRILAPTFPLSLFLRGEGQGEGLSPRMQKDNACGGSPSPAAQSAATSPRKRGEVREIYGSTSRRSASSASTSARLSSSRPASAASITVNSSCASLSRVTVT
jgi:hypothetical protein